MTYLVIPGNGPGITAHSKKAAENTLGGIPGSILKKGESPTRKAAPFCEVFQKPDGFWDVLYNGRNLPNGDGFRSKFQAELYAKKLEKQK